MLLKDELEFMHDLDSPGNLLKRVRKLLSRIRVLPFNFSQYRCEICFLEKLELKLSKEIK